MKKIIITLMTFFSILSCGNKTDSIVIASKPMTEQLVLIEILKEVIEKNTDISVKLEPAIGGGTANIWPAMQKGDIDIYPEYTGTAWFTVLKEEKQISEEEMYKLTKERYKKEYNVIWTNRYGFNDTYGLAIKKEIADKYNLKTYSDLANVSKELRFGGEYDFFEREDAFNGLERKYSFNFKEKVELDIGLKYDAIDADKVDLIDVFTTDAKIKSSDLIVLEDDKEYFPSYYAATLVRGETLEKYPELLEILEKLTDKITNEDMVKMNYEVEINKKDPKNVAHDFLLEKGIINE